MPGTEPRPLTRRRFLGTATVSFLGLAVAGSACSDDGDDAGPTTATTGPGPTSTTTAVPSEALFTELGGYEQLTAIMDDFVKDKVANDPVIAGFFVGVDLDALVLAITDFAATATGDTEHPYTGRDLRTAHTGMAITTEQFDAFVADLRASLQQFGVAPNLQDELLVLFSSSRADVVGL